MRPPRPSNARIRGLTLGLIAPLILFVLLQIPDYVPDGIAVSDPPVPSANCPPAEVVLPELCVLQRSPVGETVPAYNCDPGGADDALWRVTLRFDRLGPQAECGYEPRVVDSRSLKSALAPVSASRHDAYPRWEARRAGDAWEVHIELAPWRASTVVLTRLADAGGPERVLASKPVRLRAVRKHGVSARKSASIAFAVQCLVSLLAMALMLRFRPGRRPPLDPTAPAAPRWRSVAAISAVGGGLMAVHASIRPADFGGFDITQPWRVVMQVPLGMAFAAFAGCWIDFCRRAYHESAGGARVVALVLAVVVIALLAPRVYLATSAWTLPGVRIGYGYKTRYYTYFAVAGLIPLVTVRLRLAPPVAPALRGALASLKPAVLLAFVSLASCAVATAVAIASDRFLPNEVMLGGAGGFFKPLSGWGLVAISAPAILGIAIGVSLPEARPAWLVRFQAASHAVLAEPDAADRARRFLALLAALCRREAAEPGSLATAGAAALARHIRWLTPSYCQTDADRDQLAGALGLPRDRSDALLQSVLAALDTAISLAPPAPQARILLSHPAFSEVRATALREPGLPAGQTPVVLLAHGVLLDGPPLERVTATIDQVLSHLAASRPPAEAPVAQRILVELLPSPNPSWTPDLEPLQLAVATAAFCALRGLPGGFEVPPASVDPRSGRLSPPATRGGLAAADLPAFFERIEA